MANYVSYEIHASEEFISMLESDCPELYEGNFNGEYNNLDFEPLREISKSFPDEIITVYVQDQNGWNEPEQKYYIKNGKWQIVDSIVTFPEFNESELK